MQILEDLRYAENHEWASDEGDGAVRVGITDYAQDALGDIVYVELPETGREVAAGEAFGEIESTKSVNDVYAPVSGTVVEINEALVETPELVNEDPFGAGWLVVISASTGLGDLMDAAAYTTFTE